jgi:menaquinone-dependent protoporphyrinogen oxidase
MSKILIAYATNSGSTAEVAETLAAELTRQGHNVEVKGCRDVTSLAAYDAVIIGAPMIFGWHNTARAFVKKHRLELAAKKTAYFACAMRLTRVPGENLPGITLTLDPNLVKDPAKTGKKSFKENFTTIGYYLKPMLAAAPKVKPLNVAFFNGKLEMFRLKWWQAAFIMIVVQASPGDYRDWDAIKAWAQTIASAV